MFFYGWERQFRLRLHGAFTEFQKALERAVRGWQGNRNRERSRAKYRFHGFRPRPQRSKLSLSEALLHLELDVESATIGDLRQNFRRLSKQAHPDQGGSSESFRTLAACREIAESWLRGRHGG